MVFPLNFGEKTNLDLSALNYACAMGLPEEVILQMLAEGADPKSRNKMGAGKLLP